MSEQDNHKNEPIEDRKPDQKSKRREVGVWKPKSQILREEQAKKEAKEAEKQQKEALQRQEEGESLRMPNQSQHYEQRQPNILPIRWVSPNDQEKKTSWSQNNQNFNAHFPPVQTAQEKAEKAAEIVAAKQQREEAVAQKHAETEARRAAEHVLWPDIEVAYKPEAWRQKYQENPLFSQSVERLQTMKGWSVEEAEKTLLDILVKITFIETNLTVNGAQTLEDLFHNLKFAHEGAIPFESPLDLAAFCDSMFLNFHKAPGKRYRNTGVQGRRLVQWLKKRLDQGKVIDEDTFDDVKESFCETIQVEPALKNFACREPGLDYGSLWDLGKVPGFQYDKTTGQLTLTTEAAESLPLNLPILTDTINSKNPRKIDYSRRIEAFATNVRTDSACKRMDMLINSEELYGARGALFRRNLESDHVTIDRAFNLVRGFIRPNRHLCQVEVTSVEPTTLCFVENSVSRLPPVSFKEADKDQKLRNKQIFRSKTKK